MCEVKTFDLPMEREQLDKTMTSLLEFYNDARAKDPSVKFANEAEFRAYALVLDYKSTDSLSLLARLPDDIRSSKHIQQATALFSRMQINNQASRERLSDAPPDLVLNDVQSFFDLVYDENVPYLLGCIASLSFKDIRMCALRTIYGGLQPGSTYNQILYVQQLLGLDSSEQAQRLAQICGIQIQHSPTGDYLIVPRPNERIQWTGIIQKFRLIVSITNVFVVQRSRDHSPPFKASYLSKSVVLMVLGNFLIFMILSISLATIKKYPSKL